MSVDQNWTFVARAQTLEQVRDRLAVWCEPQGMTELPSQDSLRWHHGLSGDGEYWDVWILDNERRWDAGASPTVGDRDGSAVSHSADASEFTDR